MKTMIKHHQSKFMSVMPQVKQYETKLDTLNDWWGSVALIGKINSHRLAAVILDDMQSTKEKFGALHSNLIDNLLFEHVNKVIVNNTAKAQVTIDILIRNLFERTADVAFLATDEDIRHFISVQNNKLIDQEKSDRSSIESRLCEYVKKYSVYDEIIILDINGNVLANLNSKSDITVSNDNLIAETLATQEDYIETFRHSDLQPEQDNSLIYSCKITESDDSGARVIGVLCLCFRFDDEMKAIFKSLLDSEQNSLLLMSAEGKVIASSDANLVPIMSSFTFNAEPQLINYRGQEYLTTSCQAPGYQGFYGLGWWAMTMTPIGAAFSQKINALQDNDVSQQDTSQKNLLSSKLFSQELKEIYRSSKIVNDDLSLVVLNGQVTSLRNDAVEFMPVLEAIKKIGEDTANIFSDSISELQNTVLSSNSDDAAFMADLAINIMDRNLYERANDCRWWALTSAFQDILSNTEFSKEERQKLGGILSYINNLYTVYTNLYLFDVNEKIIAVSDVKQQHLIGQSLVQETGASATLRLDNSQQYSVSPFIKTPLYDNKETYIYNAVIRSNKTLKPVGGIGVVFDSEPEFLAILNDTLPKNEQGNVKEGCFALFVERTCKIIASTEFSPCHTGQELLVDSHFFEVEAGNKYAETYSFEGEEYILGVAASSGYREYKTTEDYDNDVLAFVFIPI